jgi:hypothetical protein
MSPERSVVYFYTYDGGGGKSIQLMSLDAMPGFDPNLIYNIFHA